MSIRTCSLLAFSILLFACQNNSQQKENASSPVLSKEDSLYRAVIAFHDEVMPKMGKIEGYQKTVQAKLDSLNKVLVNQKNKTGHELKASYEALLAQLTDAEKGMTSWMDSFQPDPKLPSKEEIEKYWEAEYIKAKKMRDDFKAALDNAALKLRQ